LMGLSLAVLWFTSASVWVVIGLGVFFCAVAAFLLTRTSR
jgi:uncharacterized membrane protein YhiD involved in acid resistance